VVQEALLRAWQLAPRLEPDGRANALLRFTVRAARNLALDEARRRRRVEPAEDEAAFERTLERLAGDGPAPPDPLLRRLIERCRALLAPQPRQALEARLAAGGGEDDRAIAARLGVKLNTFLQNFGRARRALVECLERQGVRLDEELP
jgi:DNA-directed RNA polymerase specialized sigma24 family protein